MTEAEAAISNHSSPPEQLISVPRSEHEEPFRLVLEASPDSFLMLRCLRDAAGAIVDFVIIYTNPAAARGVNRSQADLLGQHLGQLWPDGQTNGSFDRYIAVAETGNSETFEAFYNSKNLCGWFRHVVVKLNDGIAVSLSDITERKRAETERQQAELALQHREQHFRVALKTAKLGSWEHDLTTGILTCSAQCKANFGLPPEAEFTHETLFAALHPDDRSMVQAAIQQAIADRTDYEVEERCYHPDGSLHWLIVRGQIIYNAQSEPIRMVGVTLDITDRKRTEAALRESQELFQSFMNHSPIAAFMKDETGRYLYANPWVERVYQRSQAEIVGKTDFELLPPTIAQEFHLNDLAVLRRGEPMQMLETIQHDDGEHTYISFKFPFCNAAGEHVLAGVAIDISERIQAEAALQQREAELRLVTNTVPVLISFVDAEQRYRFTNQRYEEWFGQSATGLNGRYLWEVLGEAAYEAIRPYVEQVLAGQPVTFETQIPYQVIGRRDAMVNYVPRFDAQGNVEGFVALVNDITQRKQVEQQLHQSAERLRIAQQAANAGVWDWNLTTNRVTWSDEYYQLYGLDPAITEASYENWINSIVELDRDRVDQATRQTLEHQTDLNVEFRIIHPTQGERWLTAIGQTFYDHHQQPQRMTGIALDVTDRKRSEAALRKSEERFQLIAKATNDVVWDCNLLTEEMWWSERLQLVFGYQPEEMEPHMSGWANRVHPDDRDRVHTNYDACLSSDAAVWTDEYRFQRADGSYADILDRAYIIRDSSGQAVRVVGAMADISERKRVQRELQQTLQTLSTLVQASPLPIVVIEPDMTVQLWNPAAEHLFGWSAAEVVGELIPIVPEEKREECRQVREAITKGEVFAGVETYRCKRDGSTVVVNVSAAPLYNERHQFNAILLIFQDITERQQAEQALRESEEWARLAIQVGRLGGWRLHLETNQVEMDERMREIWGEPDDAGMVALPKVIDRIHPDDRDRVANAVNAAIAPQSSGVYEIEYRIGWNDGTERWVLATGQAQFAGEGASRRTVDFFGTLLDITDRKQAEEALRNSAEQLSLALTAAKLGDWKWEAATDIVTFSEQAATMFGIPPGPYMTWTRLQTLLHPDDRDRARLQVEQAIADRSDYDIEYRVMHPNRKHRWIAAKGRAQYDLSGQVLGMLGVVQDITDRKQAEAERDQLLAREQTARQAAEQANRIKDEFLAVLSHELRSPLNPILGWSKLLQTRQFDPASTVRALETIERNAKLQAQLIEDLLDVSRILRGKMVLNVAPIHLETVIDAALETVRLSVEAKGIAIQKVVVGDVGQISGDSGRLQQIIWNLLSNAVKFTPQAGQIEIRLEQVGNSAQIQVKDTGKGINPEFLPYVFEYFRQEDGTTTRKFGGLGLGLAIVRYLTEQHGGTVKAESLGEGLGATFTVSLPLLKLISSNTSDNPELPQGRSTSVPLADLRILVVDDQTDMRELMAMILQTTGADVQVAASATEALAMLSEFHPDILISDIGMPEMDG
ncbi:MAG TPA: PAS domain S-box protein, partial [Microcoleaceae cyanobacterium]